MSIFKYIRKLNKCIFLLFIQINYLQWMFGIYCQFAIELSSRYWCNNIMIIPYFIILISNRADFAVGSPSSLDISFDNIFQITSCSTKVKILLTFWIIANFSWMYFMLISFIWFVCASHSKIFHSYEDVTIFGQGLQILTYARDSWPLSSKGSLACHIYCDTCVAT